MSDHTQPTSNPLEKIQRITALLELEYRERRANDLPHIAQMFRLAVLRIRYAFGRPIAPFSAEEMDLYSLSGFKKPIDQLLLAAQQNDQLSAVTRELIRVENQLDAHYCAFSNYSLNRDEHLAEGEQIVRLEMPNSTQRRQRYIPVVSR